MWIHCFHKTGRVMATRKTDSTIQERLSESMRDFAARERISLERAAERLGLSRSAAYNRASRKPIDALKRLRQHGAETGDSIDWILGLDVPRSRSERAAIGALSDELRKLVTARCPPDAFEPTHADGDLAQFATKIVDEYWRARLEARTKHAVSRFRALAHEIEKFARDDAGPEFSLELRRAVNEVLWLAAKIDSPKPTWGEVDFRFPSIAAQRIFRKGKPKLETRFKVVEGRAFLWRYSDYDLAVYLAPGPGWGEIGQVCVKRGTKRAPRFLVEAAPYEELETIP